MNVLALLWAFVGLILGGIWLYGFGFFLVTQTNVMLQILFGVIYFIGFAFFIYSWIWAVALLENEILEGEL